MEVIQIITMQKDLADGGYFPHTAYINIFKAFAYNEDTKDPLKTVFKLHGNKITMGYVILCITSL